MLSLESVFEDLHFGLVGLLEEFKDFTVGELFVEGAVVEGLVIELLCWMLNFLELVCVVV